MPSISPILDAIVLRALEKSPERSLRRRRRVPRGARGRARAAAQRRDGSHTAALSPVTLPVDTALSRPPVTPPIPRPTRRRRSAPITGAYGHGAARTGIRHDRHHPARARSCSRRGRLAAPEPGLAVGAVGAARARRRGRRGRPAPQPRRAPHDHDAAGARGGAGDQGDAPRRSSRRSGYCRRNLHRLLARPVGTVVSQRPAAGAARKAGTIVTLLVSGGPAAVAGADGGREHARAARSTSCTCRLQGVGVHPAVDQHPEAPGDLDVRPPPGSRGRPVRRSSLVISTGPPHVAVPNVVGETQSQATLLLQAGQVRRRQGDQEDVVASRPARCSHSHRSPARRRRGRR